MRPHLPLLLLNIFTHYANYDCVSLAEGEIFSPVFVNHSMTRLLSYTLRRSFGTVVSWSDFSSFLLGLSRVPPTLVKDILRGSLRLTPTDSIKILSLIPRSHGIDRADQDRTVAQLVENVVLHTKTDSSDLEHIVCAIGRMHKSIGNYGLKALVGALIERGDIIDLTSSLSPKECVNIWHNLNGCTEARTVPFTIVTSALADSVHRELNNQPSSFDHRLISLAVRLFACNSPRSRSFLKSLEQWASLCNEEDENWTPQSYALFAYYLSQFKVPIHRETYPSLFTLLQGPFQSNLFENFTDQNLCNFAVGYSRLVKKVPKNLTSQILSRSLDKKDLMFLLKSPYLIDLTLDCLSTCRLSWSEAVIVTDIVTRNTDIDFLLLNHGKKLTKLIEGVIRQDGIENGYEKGQLLYIMGRLNYIPKRFEGPMKKYSYDPKTSAAILLTVSKLGIHERVGGADFIQDRVREVLLNGEVSDVVLTLLSCSTFRDDCSEIVKKLISQTSFARLSNIDKNQLLKVLFVVGEMTDELVDWIVDDENDWEKLKRPSPTNSSRTHKEVAKTLRCLSNSAIVKTEVFVPVVNSFIDIVFVSD